MNKKFHIKIVDNEEGVVVLDIDTDCIVGAVHQEQDGQNATVCLGYSDCNDTTIAQTAFGAIKVSKQITNKSGVNAVLMAMLAMEALKKEESKDGMDSKGEDGSIIIPFPSSRKDKQS